MAYVSLTSYAVLASLVYLTTYPFEVSLAAYHFFSLTVLVFIILCTVLLLLNSSFELLDFSLFDFNCPSLEHKIGVSLLVFSLGFLTN